MNTAFKYPGKELELFGKAINWKEYVAALIKPYIKGYVAEAGAGIGNFSRFLYTDKVTNWTYFEPDESFNKILQQKLENKQLQAGSVKETLSKMADSAFYDTIIYLDVLEHIEDDALEIELMIRHLNPGGHIILLTPAYQYLYSDFDKEIGHFRRYSKQQIVKLFKEQAGIIFCKYLDTAGYFTSLTNRLFLKQKYPTEQQIAMWNSILIPISKFTDKLFFHSFGRSLILVWQNPQT